MEVYLVTYNGYDSSWGAEIYTKGVFTNEDTAQKVAEKCKGEVIPLLIDEEANEYLGGYSE